jgi:hypothetical protein
MTSQYLLHHQHRFTIAIDVNKTSLKLRIQLSQKTAVDSFPFLNLKNHLQHRIIPWLILSTAAVAKTAAELRKTEVKKVII